MIWVLNFPLTQEGGVVCYEAQFVLRHTTPRLLRRRTPGSGGETYTRGLLPILNLIQLFFGLIHDLLIFGPVQYER